MRGQAEVADEPAEVVLGDWGGDGVPAVRDGTRLCWIHALMVQVRSPRGAKRIEPG